MNLKVVTFMGLARQTDPWNSSVRCPRRMHLTSRLYPEEPHALLTLTGCSSRIPIDRNPAIGHVHLWLLEQTRRPPCLPTQEP